MDTPSKAHGVVNMITYEKVIILDCLSFMNLFITQVYNLNFNGVCV